MDPRERATYEALLDMPSFKLFRKTVLTPARQMDRPFTCATPGGATDGAAGDYLCVDAAGLAYPCAKDTFEKTHELVPQQLEAPWQPTKVGS